jgi:O-antigen/teichoic acid export membrane protein
MDNKLPPQKIAKNTIYLTIASIGQKVLAFLYFILIARLAGVSGTGQYFFAVSFTTIFSIFADFGFSSVLIRESAKNNEKAQEFLSNVLGIKLILSALTYLAVVIIINLLNYSPLVKIMVYLAGIVMVLDSFHLSFYAVFRGLQNLKYESIGIIAGQTITILVGSISLMLGLPLYMLTIALACGSTFNFLYSSILLFRKANISLKVQLNLEVLLFLAKIAFPFALAGIFVKVYSYLDTVLLSKLASDAFVGWWSVVYKITYAFQFIPMAFTASIFPAMSYYFVSNYELLRKTFERAIFYLMIIAVPIAFGIFSLAEQIVLKIYGTEYAASVVPLKIAIFALIFIFLNFPIGSLLNACNRQKANTAAMGLTMVFDILLCVFLIPKFKLVGAALAVILSHGTLFLIGLILANKVVNYNKIFLLKKFLKVIFSALVMAVLVIYLKRYVSWLILIPGGAIVYFGVLYLIYGITKDDLYDILKVIKREKSVELVNGKQI